MYIKIASIIEILLGLVMGGLVCLVWLIARSAPGPAGMGAILVVPPMLLLSIFLIIFGCKKVWLPSIVTLVIATALFTIMGLGYPICFLGSIGAIICLILFILGKIFPAPPKPIFPIQRVPSAELLFTPWELPKELLKSAKSAANKYPKITILLIAIMAILAIAGVCYFYKIPQRMFTTQPSEPETISSETIPPVEEKPTQACVEVIKNGDPSNKINVVFIGDRYSSNEMDLFSSDVDKFIDEEGTHRGLLSVEPFKSYQNYFNFYRIDKSYEFGCEKQACSISEIQSGAKMECPSLDELVVLSNYYEKGLQVGWSVPHFCVVERVHNTYIEKPLGYEEWEFFAQATFAHEFGHSFGDLADEYSSMKAISRLDRANCDVAGCPKWCSGEIDTSKPCYKLIIEFENCITKGKSSQECLEELQKKPEGSGIEACDIGVNCLEGTGCVWNCKGTNGYKSSNPSVPDRPEGWKEIPCKMLSPEQDVFCPVCQRHLIEVIENYKK